MTGRTCRADIERGGECIQIEVGVLQHSSNTEMAFFCRHVRNCGCLERRPEMTIKVMHFGLGPIGSAVARQVAARKGLKIVGLVRRRDGP